MSELSHPPRTGELPKTLTGIRGLDEVTRGGLPTGRPTLVCGGPGSGKTLLALTFLVNGAVRFDEPGVLMTFEENGDEIANDVASLGFDLPALIEAKKHHLVKPVDLDELARLLSANAGRIVETHA